MKNLTLQWIWCSPYALPTRSQVIKKIDLGLYNSQIIIKCEYQRVI